MTSVEAQARARLVMPLTALLCGAVLVMAPMAAPVLVPALGLSLVPAFRAEKQSMADLARAVAGPSRVFAGLSLLGVYLLFNAAWSSVPAFAFKVAGFYFVLGFAVLLAVRAVPEKGSHLTRGWSLRRS
jgi:hypothetical protein